DPAAFRTQVERHAAHMNLLQTHATAAGTREPGFAGGSGVGLWQARLRVREMLSELSLVEPEPLAREAVVEGQSPRLPGIHRIGALGAANPVQMGCLLAVRWLESNLPRCVVVPGCGALLPGDDRQLRRPAAAPLGAFDRPVAELDPGARGAEQQAAAAHV